MAPTSKLADELSRLQAVQARIRALAREHGWFGDAIRAAFDDFLALWEQYLSEKLAVPERERQLARGVLAQGRLYDAKAKGDPDCILVLVNGLCPIELATALEKAGSSDSLPIDLNQRNAAAALAALNRQSIRQARDLPAGEQASMAKQDKAALDAGTHKFVSWSIMVARPADWQEPVDPHHLSRAALSRLSDRDYLMLALHRLGGLADVGAIRPIVPKPEDTDDSDRDLWAYHVWRSRFPIDPRSEENDQPRLSPEVLPADVAEQLLSHVEMWVTEEAPKQADPQTAMGAIESRKSMDEHRANSKSPASPAGAEAIDEFDASLLAFLNKKPSLRRKIAEVLPDDGPQDRKAVAKRLRKLADRDLPLVDYPKDGRSGVAILPAGVEALKRATAPTPP